MGEIISKELKFSVVDKDAKCYEMIVSDIEVKIKIGDEWFCIPKNIVEIFLNMNKDLKEAFDICEYEWF